MDNAIRSASQASAASWTALRAAQRSATVSQVPSMKRVLSTTRSALVTLVSGSAFGEGLFGVGLFGLGPSTAKVTKSVITTKSATQAQAGSLSRGAQATRTTTQTQSATKAVFATRVRTATQAQSVTFSRSVTLLRKATQPQTATVLRVFSVVKSVLQISSAARQATVQKNLSTTQAQAASLAHSGKTATLNTAVSVIPSRVSIILSRVLSQSQPQAASLSRSFSVFKSAQVAIAAALQRGTSSFARTLTTTQTTAASVNKTPSRTLSSIVLEVISLGRNSSNNPLVMTASVTASASVRRAAPAVRTAVASVAASFVKHLRSSYTASRAGRILGTRKWYRP